MPTLHIFTRYKCNAIPYFEPIRATALLDAAIVVVIGVVVIDVAAATILSTE